MMMNEMNDSGTFSDFASSFVSYNSTYITISSQTNFIIIPFHHWVFVSHIVEMPLPRRLACQIRTAISHQVSNPS
jgi:hypothetical protein